MRGNHSVIDLSPSLKVTSAMISEFPELELPIISLIFLNADSPAVADPMRSHRLMMIPMILMNLLPSFLVISLYRLKIPNPNPIKKSAQKNNPLKSLSPVLIPSIPMIPWNLFGFWMAK